MNENDKSFDVRISETLDPATVPKVPRKNMQPLEMAVELMSVRREPISPELKNSDKLKDTHPVSEHISREIEPRTMIHAPLQAINNASAALRDTVDAMPTTLGVGSSDEHMADKGRMNLPSGNEMAWRKEPIACWVEILHWGDGTPDPGMHVLYRIMCGRPGQRVDGTFREKVTFRTQLNRVQNIMEQMTEGQAQGDLLQGDIDRAELLMATLV